MYANRLFLLLWIPAFLAAVEIGLQYRASQRGWVTPLFGDPVAAMSGSGAPESPGSAAPAFGPREGFPFRSRVYPVRGRDGATRYWVASASYAEDTYLPPEQIFPVRLEALLASESHPAEVLNASNAGTGILENARMLEELAPVWRPDVAILYQMSLEINALTTRYAVGGASEGADDGAVDLDAAAGGSRPNWTVRFIESTTTYALLKGYFTAWLATTRVLIDELPPAAIDDFASRVETFVDTARGAGVVPVLCTFATSHQREDLGRFPSTVVTMLFKYNMHLSLLAWVDSVERLNAVIERIARERGVLLFDVQGALRDRPELFRDFVHFTPDGHALVAETIARGLRTGRASVPRSDAGAPE